jgi:methylenetetrahydrofolate dehydrogenase (NADP+) / methenyltetrahydrofolate cyclohydrolase
MIYKTRTLAAEFESYLSSKIASLKALPTLYVIQIGDNFASSKYIAHKKLKCETLGLTLNLKQYSPDTDPKTIERFIESLSGEKCGLILQLPVPESFNYLITKINYNIDIDLLGPNSDIFAAKELLTPTVGGIDLVLKKLSQYENHKFIDFLKAKIDLSGKIVAVVGQGKLVGAPLLSYLRDRNATIISLNKETPNPEKLTKMSHIIISAAGVKNLIDKSWIGNNTIVIDSATLESNGNQKGDVDKEKIWENTILCPSPGGIGQLTILYLIYNLLLFNEKF